METRSGRPRGDAEQFGNLDEGQPEVVVKDEDGPLLHREMSVRSLELVAIGDRSGLVGGRWTVEGQDSDIGAPRLGPLRLVVTRVDENAVDPCFEAIRVAKMRKTPPGEDKGVLQSVLGPTAVAQDPEGHRVEDVADLVHQDRERLPIAPTGLLDEVSIHPRPPSPQP
jgi:hypothetical protein